VGVPKNSKGPDLTFFRFNAYKWSNSESVEMMTAEECGQYILLLVKAWNGGKDTTLPDDLAWLAKQARSRRVSERVLAMFPVVSDSGDIHHGRRRNQTLYDVWLDTQEVSAKQAAKANKRWESRGNAPALPLDYTGDANKRKENTIQENTTEEKANPGLSVVSLEENRYMKAKDFSKKCVPIWQQIYGAGCILRYPERSKEELGFLTDTCDPFLLLEAFELWAKDRFADGEGHDTWAISKFIKHAPDYMLKLRPANVNVARIDKQAKLTADALAEMGRAYGVDKPAEPEVPADYDPLAGVV
jgi:uncharacterized protein YdaU (DUF1376 family)